ncbi:MAG: FKBP-type peptidyl-prolyl cis-trans isomerase [Gammaproteobacteria bacterium]|nr:FKBP-type peptidyl-prolyl cis-trans isomerase [Gammaproteobacteria bacterium]
MLRIPNILMMLILAPVTAIAEQGLETLEQKASYSFGVDFAKRLKQQGIDLDIKALNRGIKDQASGNKLAFEEAEMNQFKTEYSQQLRAELQKQQAELAAKNLEAGNKFLAENASKDGVVTTESGLQYKVIKSGDGPSPKADDTVTTHYRGTLIDGREFDSSYSRGQPASFPVNGVIKGWTEALQLMKVGDKWELYIPSDLAYGPAQRSELIQPNSTLVFELELLGIK